MIKGGYISINNNMESLFTGRVVIAFLLSVMLLYILYAIFITDTWNYDFVDHEASSSYTADDSDRYPHNVTPSGHNQFVQKDTMTQIEESPSNVLFIWCSDATFSFRNYLSV